MRAKRCFVCDKTGCWSYNHTAAEQEATKDRFKVRNKDVFSNKFGSKFEARYNQFVADYEGSDIEESSASETEIKEAFQSLTVSAKPTPSASYHVEFEQFHTSTGNLTVSEALETERLLVEKSATHAITAEDPTLPQGDDEENQPEEAFATSVANRYSADKFRGIMIDTGATAYSTAGFGQFKALKRIDETIQLNTQTKGTAKVYFGIGSTSSIGSAMVRTPVGRINFHVVEADTPFLLSLADMDYLGLRFDNLKNTITSAICSVPVVRQFGHAFMLWKISLHSLVIDSLLYKPCYLIDVELARLHRRFGHPSVKRLRTVLERAGHDVKLKTVEYLTKFCKHCQLYRKSPGRFRFTLRDDVSFNYNIVVDVLYINNKLVLHIIDEATRF